MQKENGMSRIGSVVLCCLLFSPYALAQEVVKQSETQHGQGGHKALAIAQARIHDADAVSTITAEGKAIYQSAESKGDYSHYKYGAYKLLDKGEFRQAIRMAAVALYVSIDQRNDTQTAFAKLILAQAYQAAGDTDHARLYASEAKRHHVHSSFRSDVLSAADKILGDVALRLGDIEGALTAYKGSISAALGEYRFYSREALAVTYAKAEQFNKAREAISDSEGYVGVLSQKSQAAAQGNLLRLKGRIALGEGKPDEAVSLFEGALAKILTSDEDGAYDKFWILEGVGRAKLIMGDKVGALTAYLEAIDQSEKVRRRFRSEMMRSALFGEMQDVYGQATRLLIEAGKIESAWEINEQGRARALLDMLRNRVELAGSGTVTSEASGKSIKLQELVSGLKLGEVVVSYRVMDDRTYVWVTRNAETKVFTLNQGRNNLGQRVQEFRDAIIQESPNAKALGAALHDIVIKPLGLTNGDEISIIPHDALHYLPFQALWTGDGYLLQKVSISYAPSAAALHGVIAKQTQASDKLFALGNPDLGNPSLALPGAQKEVEAITKMFPNAEAYFQTEATRGRFLKSSPQARLVHVAAHGIVDKVDPLYSKLMLAKDTDHPGPLEAKDIYGLSLGGADLVVLSACDSGLGKVTKGDEVWGFTRSFLSAGATSLLVSLWPVDDDATQIMMSRFYSELKKGASKRKALRDAEMAVFADPRFSSPSYWAAFNLVGNPR
jgi:CHAT domain-containing protein